jgi:hypothetical protein
MVACRENAWAAALAPLAAGARVGIAGVITGRLQMMAEWARRSPACRHRGVKFAIAARAREHAAEAAAAAKGLQSGAAAGAASSVAHNSATAAETGSVCASAAADATTASAAAATAGPTTGVGKRPKGHKGRRGAESNRAEELPLVDEAAEVTALCAPAVAVTATAVSFTSAAPAAAALGALSTCEDPAASTAAAGAGTSVLNAPLAAALAASVLILPEDPSSQPAAATGASLDAPELPVHYTVGAICADGSVDARGPLEPDGHTPAVVPCTASANTCEPGAEFASGANTCEPGEATATGVDEVAAATGGSARC